MRDVVFILGAGASRAADAPLVEESPPVPPEIAAQVEAYLR